VNYGGKVRRLQSLMGERGFDIAILNSNKCLDYFVGAEISTAALSTCLVIPRDGEPIMVYYAADADRIRNDWHTGGNVPIVKEWSLELGGPHREVRYEDRVGEALREAGANSRSVIGIEYGFMTLAEFEALRKVLPSQDVRDITPTIDDLMIIKDEEKLQYLRRAADIATIGIEAAFEAVCPGMAEVELAAEAERAMSYAGMDHIWICTQVGSGIRNGFFEAPASEKLIQRGRWSGWTSTPCISAIYPIRPGTLSWAGSMANMGGSARSWSRRRTSPSTPWSPGRSSATSTRPITRSSRGPASRATRGRRLAMAWGR